MTLFLRLVSLLLRMQQVKEDQLQWCLAIMIIDRYLNKHLRKGAFYHFRLQIDEGIVRADGLQLEI